ncbi:lysosome-associated membrane glycoprotein 1 [Elgaria multicarinata webbii]|uniref:lysosome-associated membrane glycoprotein 1 n=1 Tax=Elgaria multicarinata webbii TaxID=159646 RepID=UPI002FCCD740
MAARCVWGLLLAAVMLGVSQASSTFQVKDKSGKICILAHFSVEFTVEYVKKDKKQENSTFELPPNAHVLEDVSTCGSKNPTLQVLVVGFGNGHSLRMAFEEKESSYMVNNLTFKYNLSDTNFFPNATGGVKETTKETDIKAPEDTIYTCLNKNKISMENVVILLSNVTLEAYLKNSTFSKNETVCAEDKVSTTHVVPVTTHVAPTTTSVAPPTPTQTPYVGHYNVTGVNGTCLLAFMGLQVNVTYNVNDKAKSEVFNLPSTTSSVGSCENSKITLNLTTSNISLSFSFVQNATTEKYFLQGIIVNASLPSEATKKDIYAANNTLNSLKATVGKSYKCTTEESVWLSNEASVNIFNVQIQAFNISGDKFGAVEECPQDENNMLIPIIVGAALAGLVLIVLIAYLIGRKRSHAGYQTI